MNFFHMFVQIVRKFFKKGISHNKVRVLESVLGCKCLLSIERALHTRVYFYKLLGRASNAM